MSTKSVINAAVVGLKNLRVCEFVKNSPLRQVVKSRLLHLSPLAASVGVH